MSRPGNKRVLRTPEGWRLRGRGPAVPQANRFLERVELRGLAEGSVRTYAFDLLRIVRWAGRRRIERLGPEQFCEFVRTQRAAIHPVTLNRHLRLLQALRAFRRGEEPIRQPRRGHRRRRGPALPLVKEPQRILRPLTDREAGRMAEALRTHRDRAILGLMWAAGLRVGEVLGLREEDIDWEHAALHVTGKGRRERCLPLAAALGRLLRRYLRAERPLGATTARLFVVLKGPRRGRPMTYAGVRRLFRYWRERLRLPDAHPHRFRHTFATNMVRHGMRLPVLMRLLGHTWIHTTARYVHFDDQDVRTHYENALAELEKARHRAAGDGRPLP